MIYVINYKKYLNIRARRMPCIMYFIDLRYKHRDNVLKIMEEICKLYPLVICYQVNLFDHISKSIDSKRIKSPYVFCMKKYTKQCEISPFNNSGLHNLFKTVYNDCVCNYFKQFNCILLKNNQIKPFYIHKLYDLKIPSYKISFNTQSYEDTVKRYELITSLIQNNNETSKISNELKINFNTNNRYLVSKKNINFHTICDKNCNNIYKYSTNIEYEKYQNHLHIPFKDNLYSLKNIEMINNKNESKIYSYDSYIKLQNYVHEFLDSEGQKSGKNLKQKTISHRKSNDDIKPYIDLQETKKLLNEDKSIYSPINESKENKYLSIHDIWN